MHVYLQQQSMPAHTAECIHVLSSDLVRSTDMRCQLYTVHVMSTPCQNPFCRPSLLQTCNTLPNSMAPLRYGHSLTYFAEQRQVLLAGGLDAGKKAVADAAFIMRIPEPSTPSQQDWQQCMWQPVRFHGASNFACRLAVSRGLHSMCQVTLQCGIVNRDPACSELSSFLFRIVHCSVSEHCLCLCCTPGPDKVFTWIICCCFMFAVPEVFLL